MLGSHGARVREESLPKTSLEPPREASSFNTRTLGFENSNSAFQSKQDCGCPEKYFLTVGVLQWSRGEKCI